MQYDIAIIGSGPCCLGYLLGLSDWSGRGIVFSSDKLVQTGSGALHPKLYANGSKIVDLLPGLKYGPTCNWGGLSSAWGGILIVPDDGKLDRLLGRKFGRELALASYKRVLDLLKREFALYVLQGTKFQRVTDVATIDLERHRTYVITGANRYAWENAGISLAEPLRRLTEIRGFDISMRTIERIEFDRKRCVWEVSSIDGRLCTCRELVLASGGIGNLRLLQGVYAKGSLATFDHVPLQVYCAQFGNNALLEDFSDHATPLRTVLRGQDFITAAYCVDSLSDDFLEKKQSTRIARGFLPRRLLERLYFVQIWHDSLTYQIGLRGPIGYRHEVDWAGLIRQVASLAGIGLAPLFAHPTSPGEGFHYMSITDDSGSTAVDVLKCIVEESGDSLAILGGLGLSETMLENPTLTFMADACASATARSMSRYAQPDR